MNPDRSSTATRRDVAAFVARRATALAAGLRAGTGASQAQLAALRHAVGDDPAAQPALWGTVLDGLEDLDAPDRVTRGERAAFHALTLFAVHQQSRSEPMHVSGQGLGTSIRELQRRRPDEGSLMRRFSAAVSSDGQDQLARRLRPLVQQLRAAGIPLDYAQLASDLMEFDTVRGCIAVRQRWGRQLYRAARPAAATESPETTETTEDNDTSKEQS